MMRGSSEQSLFTLPFTIIETLKLGYQLQTLILMSRVLEKFRFFGSFYRLGELGQRDDIVRLLIECFDYTM